MKFKLDENIAHHGRNVLVAAGHDVMTVAEQQLSGVSDQQLYDVIRDEGRVLVTLDHDFGQVLRFPPQATAGIVVLECKGRVSPTAIIARIKDLAAVLRTQPINRQLWIVEPGRVRMHERDENTVFE
jgi:predicted nuclease of predicted toxin-antitoxin system